MKRKFTHFLLTAFILLLQNARADFHYVATFDGTKMDPNYTLATYGPDYSTSPGVGWSNWISGGLLHFAKESGTGNGLARCNSRFLVTGDFQVTVRADRSNLGMAQCGLVAFLKNGVWLNSFFEASPSGTISANLWNGAQLIQSVTLPDATSNALFRVRREGSTLYAEFDTGSGFVTTLMAADPSQGDPAMVGTFLIQEFGQPDSNVATFDDLTVHAQGVIPYLSFERDGGDILLSWPAAADGFVLESTATPSTPMSWNPVPELPAIEGNQSVVKLKSLENLKFYRLRHN